MFVSRGLVALVLSLGSLAVAACRADGAPTPANTAKAGQPAPAAGAAQPVTAASPATAANQPTATDRLYVLAPAGSTEAITSLVNATDGSRGRSLPYGVATRDWSVLYTTSHSTSSSGLQTLVRALDPAAGDTLRQITLDGSFAPPWVGINLLPGGLSYNGIWLALAEPGAGDAPVGARRTSRFAVLNTAFTQPPQTVALDGDFIFDGIDNQGVGLYLVENLSGGHYQVRRYDLRRGALDSGVVVDKAHGETVMQGLRLDAVPSASGEWLFSLYVDGNNHPFVHALNLAQGWALCLDLPAGPNDFEQQLLWSLAMSPDGNTLYAVNGASGTVVEIDPTQPAIRHTHNLTLVPSSDDPVTWLLDRLTPRAEAKRLVTHGAAVRPDGTILYALGENGVLAVNTADLSPRGHYLVTWPVSSLALSPDGARLYALHADRGVIAVLDAATGRQLAELPGIANAGAILRVETQTAPTTHY